MDTGSTSLSYTTNSQALTAPPFSNTTLQSFFYFSQTARENRCSGCFTNLRLEQEVGICSLMLMSVLPYSTHTNNNVFSFEYCVIPSQLSKTPRKKKYLHHTCEGTKQKQDVCTQVPPLRLYFHSMHQNKHLKFIFLKPSMIIDLSSFKEIHMSKYGIHIKKETTKIKSRCSFLVLDQLQDTLRNKCLCFIWLRSLLELSYK